MSPEGKVVIRRTIHDSYGFRFSSPFQYLRRMAEFSAQVPAAAIRLLGVSRNPRGNGVIWTVQPYIEGTHLTQTELVADLKLQGWQPAGSLHNHLVFEHTQVSRHHFLLEACPPQASLRDLGSMNGTHMKPGIMLSRAVDQFKREMAVIAKLQHPHIVRFLDSGPDEGTFLFAGQIRQTRLRRLELRRHPLPPPHRKIPLPLRSQARPH